MTCKLFAALLSIGALLTACATGKEHKPDGGNDTFGLDRTSVTLSRFAESPAQHVTIKSGSAWTATLLGDDAGEWLAVSQLSGNAGESEIALSAKSDNNTYTSRRGYVKFAAVDGSGITTLTVEQSPLVRLVVEQKTMVAGFRGGLLDGAFRCNSGYELTVDEESVAWLSIDDVVEMPQRDGTTKVGFKANVKAMPSGTNTREGTITISCGDETRTIDVIQYADGKEFAATPAEICLMFPESGAYIIQITHIGISQEELSVSCDEAWIDPRITGGQAASCTSNLVLNIEENFGETRNATVTVSAGSSAWIEVPVTQAQAYDIGDDLVWVSPNYAIVPADGGQTEIGFSRLVPDAEVSVTAEVEPDEQMWYEASLSGDRVVVSADANNGTEGRSGRITMLVTAGGMTQSIIMHVDQNAVGSEPRAESLISSLKPETVYIPAAGAPLDGPEKITVSLMRPMDARVGINGDAQWFTFHHFASGAGADYIILYADTNDTEAERRGTLHVVVRDNGVTAEKSVTVIQPAADAQ